MVFNLASHVSPLTVQLAHLMDYPVLPAQKVLVSIHQIVINVKPVNIQLVVKINATLVLLKIVKPVLLTD